MEKINDWVLYCEGRLARVQYAWGQQNQMPTPIALDPPNTPPNPSDPTALLALGSTMTVGVGVTAVATLKAWLEWLDLRRAEIEKVQAHGSPRRAEIVDLRERVKRLEAIANG